MQNEPRAEPKCWGEITVDRRSIWPVACLSGERAVPNVLGADAGCPATAHLKVRSVVAPISSQPRAVTNRTWSSIDLKGTCWRWIEKSRIGIMRSPHSATSRRAPDATLRSSAVVAGRGTGPGGFGVTTASSPDCDGRTATTPVESRRSRNISSSPLKRFA